MCVVSIPSPFNKGDVNVALLSLDFYSILRTKQPIELVFLPMICSNKGNTISGSFKWYIYQEKIHRNSYQSIYQTIF